MKKKDVIEEALDAEETGILDADDAASLADTIRRADIAGDTIKRADLDETIRRADLDTDKPADLVPADSGPPEYVIQGGDFDEVVAAQQARGDETIVINMGPQHPSTHGVLRLEVELDGESVLSIRPGIGFLHSGIEKSMEHRTWAQGTTFVTRMDYLIPMFNETAYCLAVEKLAGIEVPERADILRVLVMELNRMASHLVAIGTGGMEIGALTVMTIAFREREMILDFFEALCGTRMNHAYVRPGGVSIDLPENGLARLRTVIEWFHKHLGEYAGFCNENPIFKARMSGIATLSLAQAMALGVTGPPLRATGYPWDLRKKQPYCGYENYDFDVITWDTADAYGRYRVRLSELAESLKIIEQCYDKLEATAGQPYKTEDVKVAMPGRLTLGPDGQGNAPGHVKEIMGTSMESLIHHFKLVSEGFRVPEGQVYQAIESPKGELACQLVSDGGTRPYRCHFRDPGFHHLQALPMICEGGMMSDIVVAVASLDPVLGGVDR